MSIRKIVLLLVLVVVASPAFGQQSIFEDFSSDVLPLSWEFSGDGGAERPQPSDGSLTVVADTTECCVGFLTGAPHANAILETEVEFAEVDDAFFMFRFRDEHDRIVTDQDNGYWAGLLVATGELGIGASHSGNNITITARDVFLPTGGLSDGDTLKMRLSAIDADLELSVWEAGADFDSATSLKWTDPVERNPEGGWVGLISNPRGTTGDLIRINSFELTPLPGCRTGSEGDLNVDGTVDFADFLILAQDFGNLVDSHLDGDLDCGGTVNFADFLTLAANFEGSAVASAVPEPANRAYCLSILFAVLGMGYRHRPDHLAMKHAWQLAGNGHCS